VKEIPIDSATVPVEHRAEEALPYPDDATLIAIEAAACEFIREAGRLVMERYGGPLEIDYKGKGKSDPVTEVDRAVEAYLARAVTGRFPGHAVLGEEGQDPPPGEDPEYEWIVDPVDGTLNFMNRFPLFAISIGVLHRRRPVVGVLLFPVAGELLQARRGGGARRNGEPLRVGGATEPSNSLLAGLPPGFWFQFSAGRAVRRRLGEPRSAGSIAYEMGLVAGGAFHYALFRSPKIWDVAGGVVIVREAGGAALRYSARSKAWEPLDRFVAPPSRDPAKPATLRNWAGPVLVGAAPIVDALAPHIAPRSVPVALRKVLRRYQGWRKHVQAAKEAQAKAEAEARQTAANAGDEVGVLVASAEPEPAPDAANRARPHSDRDAGA
jgi:myo-inositol-1(or 4)-monophosphatase